MENASKALIMAGEVVIAVLVIGLIVYINVLFGSFSNSMNSKIAESQVSQFNNNFFIYSGRYNITVPEIATIINFAKQTNDSNDLSRTNPEASIYYIDVTIDGKDFFNSSSYIDNDSEYDNSNLKFKQKVNEFLNNNNKLYFTCNCKASVIVDTKQVNIKSQDIDITTDTTTKMVTKINFNTIPETYNITNAYQYSIKNIL